MCIRDRNFTEFTTLIHSGTKVGFLEWMKFGYPEWKGSALLPLWFLTGLNLMFRKNRFLPAQTQPSLKHNIIVYFYVSKWIDNCFILRCVSFAAVTLRQAGGGRLVRIVVCDNVGHRQCRRSGIGSFDVVEQSGNEVPRPLPLSSGWVCGLKPSLHICESTPWVG